MKERLRQREGEMKRRERKKWLKGGVLSMITPALASSFNFSVWKSYIGSRGATGREGGRRGRVVTPISCGATSLQTSSL